MAAAIIADDTHAIIMTTTIIIAESSSPDIQVRQHKNLRVSEEHLVAERYGALTHDLLDHQK